MTKIGTVIGAMASFVVLAAGGTSSLAQESGTVKAPYLRVEWQLESARGKWQNVCGRVYNEREVPARHVTIMFEGFDAQGRQVSQRFGEVIGDVPAGAYSIFCLMIQAGGASYRVTVPAVEWGFNAGQ